MHEFDLSKEILSEKEGKEGKKGHELAIPQQLQADLDTLIEFTLDSEMENYEEGEGKEGKEPFSEYAQKIRGEMEEGVKNMHYRLALGRKLFKDHLEFHDMQNPNFPPLLPQWEKILTQAKEQLSSTEVALPEDSQKSIQETYNIPWEYMDKAFELAKELHFEKRYEEAEGLSLFLCTLQSHVFDYWLVEAACLYALGKFDEARLAYVAALGVEPTHPFPFFQIACCLVSTQERQAALQALEICLGYAKEDLSSYASLILEAEKLQHALSQEK